MKSSYVSVGGMLAAVFCVAVLAQTVDVDYPTGFRAWQHVKTAIIEPGHPLEDTFGGIHHIYANDKAMHGLQSGTYEDGSVFVFDLLDYSRNDHFVAETERIRIDVMQYDKRAFSETGGWGFASFVNDSESGRVEQDVVSNCYDCHVPAKESGYVYSKYRP